MNKMKELIEKLNVYRDNYYNKNISFTYEEAEKALKTQKGY